MKSSFTTPFFCDEKNKKSFFHKNFMPRALAIAGDQASHQEQPFPDEEVARENMTRRAESDDIIRRRGGSSLGGSGREGGGDDTGSGVGQHIKRTSAVLISVEFQFGPIFLNWNSIFQLNMLLSKIAGKQTDYMSRSSVHPTGWRSTVLIATLSQTMGYCITVSTAINEIRMVEMQMAQASRVGERPMSVLQPSSSSLLQTGHRVSSSAPFLWIFFLVGKLLWASLQRKIFTFPGKSMLQSTFHSCLPFGPRCEELVSLCLSEFRKRTPKW